MATRLPLVRVAGRVVQLPDGDTIPAPAPAAHSHAVADVTGLESALAAKLDGDFTALTSVGTVNGTEVVAVNRSGTTKTTVLAILTWMLSRANSWTGRQTFKDTAETVYAITDGPSVSINPANGSIQTWTLSGVRTPTLTSIVSGQSVTLEIAPGAFSVTFTGVTWLKVGGGGAAPVLPATGVSTVVLWKVGTTLKGFYVGTA